MEQGTIKKTLMNFGLSEKEVELYIFLGKRGPLKSGEITKNLKMNRGQVYRILKNLQKKVLVEQTFDFPTRFTAVPLDTVIDSFIKSKQEEVTRIEETKKDLLLDWENIRQTELDSSLEKFVVIEGNKKIYHKISQMIKETSSRLLMALTITDLSRAEQFGVFEILNKHHKKSKMQFQALTQLSKQNLKAVRLLKTKLKSVTDFRGTNPRLGSPKIFRMVIRDNDEIILFISDKKKESLKNGKEVCLHTNCQSIIDAFSGVFKDSWKNSRDIEDWITEIETGKIPSTTQVIKDSVAARDLYYKVLGSAKEEILIVTSSNGLIRLLKEESKLREWSGKGINLNVMAPIIGENLNAAQELLEFGEVRHVPVGYLETTIVDGHHLFQFKHPLEGKRKSVQTSFFSDAYYTNDINHVEKTKKMLFDIWRKTRIPSVVTLEPTTSSPEFTKYPFSKMETRNVVRRISVFRSLKDEVGITTKREVLDKFNNAKKYPIDQYPEKKLPNKLRFFGNGAFALILPPKNFELPKFIVAVFKHNDKSSFGEENVMHIYLPTDKRDGYHYENVAVIHTNPKAINYRRTEHTNTLAANNIRLLRENQLQINRGGNTLFVGWTVPITLVPSEYVLPPSCILFEGYGEIKSGTLSMISPSRRKNKVVYNYLEAFVTFFHPSSKYSGAGTEGFIDTELVRTSYP